jgi:hypothetical protein
MLYINGTWILARSTRNECMAIGVAVKGFQTHLEMALDPLMASTITLITIVTHCREGLIPLYRAMTPPAVLNLCNDPPAGICPASIASALFITIIYMIGDRKTLQHCEFFD